MSFFCKPLLPFIYVLKIFHMSNRSFIFLQYMCGGVTCNVTLLLKLYNIQIIYVLFITNHNVKSIFLGFTNNFVMVPKALVQPLHLVLSALFYKGVERPSIEYRGSLCVCVLHMCMGLLCIFFYVLHICLVPIETGKVR